MTLVLMLKELKKSNEGVNDAGVANFYKLVDDASQDLYTGCKKNLKIELNSSVAPY